MIGLFLRSLVLASAISFVLPIALIGLMLVSLSLLKQIPRLETIGQVSVEQVTAVLTVFGSGSASQGAIVIGLTCGVVGALFDSYAFYRHHILRQG